MAVSDVKTPDSWKTRAEDAEEELREARAMIRGLTEDRDRLRACLLAEVGDIIRLLLGKP